jgi:hypothetical protein
LHCFAADAEKLGFGTLVAYGFDEAGGENVAGGFAYDEVNYP